MNKIAITSLIFSFFVVNSPNFVWADKVPFNPEFPNANYPYFGEVDGCSSWDPDHPEYIRDDWKAFDFTDACNGHDYCYMSLDVNRGECEDEFRSHLMSECSGKVARSVCVSFAEAYAAAARSFGKDAFEVAQVKARKYSEYVKGFLRQTFQTYVGRPIPEAVLQVYLEKLKTNSLWAIETDVYSRFGEEIVRRVYPVFTGESLPESLVPVFVSELKTFGYSRLPERIVLIDGGRIIEKIYYDVFGQPISDTLKLVYFAEYNHSKDTQQIRQFIRGLKSGGGEGPVPPECFTLTDPLEIFQCRNL